jgi:hypothetical protein
METKKSIVRTAIFKKSGNGQYGEWHSFEITFDNGDKGDYMSKTNPQEKFKEGVEVEYTIEKKENGNYTNYVVKPIVKDQFQQGKGNPAYEHKRVALKCAVDLASAGKIELKDIATYSDNFLTFLNK